MTFVRREVRSLAPGDQTLQAYADAVRVMKERPDSNPTSWAYQAAIHGTPVSPLPPLGDQCKHGSWYFLPWHRMFLYYFERIVREVVKENGGPEDWALPYWNYGLGGDHASLPDAFRNPTNADGSPNPLYVEERAPGMNGDARLPETAISDAAAMARPDFIGVAEFGGGVTAPGQQFWSQTGRIEQTPHNVVHVLVGGQRGWMADPEQAAKDPIFWLHHSNIDRIWAVWNDQGNTDPDAAQWVNQAFEFFDADGTQVSKTCGEVVDTIEDLDYTYDVLPAPTPAAAEAPPAMETPEFEEPKVVGAGSEEVSLTGETTAIRVEVDERAEEEVAGASRESDPRRLYLNIEDIEGDRNPGTVYGVYVNLPDDPGEKDLEAHLVTNVSFFGIERARNPRQDEPPHSMRVSVDVGHLLGAIGEGDAWDGSPIYVTFRPIGLYPGKDQTEEYLRSEEPDEYPPVKVGRVSLSVE